jgi:predicted nucleotidyltransferase
MTGLEDKARRAQRGLHENGFCMMLCAMSVAELPIQIDREKVAAFCRARGIRKLSLFGSVLREDFDPARSDVDVLAEFEPDALKGVGFRYFGYGEELAAIIGRKVDFCSRLNQYIEAAVRREAIAIYERA